VALAPPFDFLFADQPLISSATSLVLMRVITLVPVMPNQDLAWSDQAARIAPFLRADDDAMP